MSNTVSIHPYFQVHEGKLDDAKAILPKLADITSQEDTCLWYDFSINGNTIHCREAYIGAQGLLTHVQNVDPLIQAMLEISDLVRVEIHGPAEELAKLKEPMDGLNPEYFEFICGIGKPS